METGQISYITLRQNSLASISDQTLPPGCNSLPGSQANSGAHGSRDAFTSDMVNWCFGGRLKDCESDHELGLYPVAHRWP